MNDVFKICHGLAIPLLGIHPTEPMAQIDVNTKNINAILFERVKTMKIPKMSTNRGIVYNVIRKNLSNSNIN